MNNAEAVQLLDNALDDFGRQSYADLVRRIEADSKADPVRVEPIGAAGARYQLEIDVFWDHRPGGAVHVMGSIDDGGFWRSVAPLTRSFIRQEDEPEVRIEYLDAHVDAIPTLAAWHHAEWSSITPELSVADRIAGFEERARRGSVPTGFVALRGGEVAGMACLVECDIETHCHLTPWLATVLVGPAYRGHGIGSMLSRNAMREAWALGSPALYLFTFDRQPFYDRLGWTFLEWAKLAGRPGAIMLCSRPDRTT
jgi:GNAT superfamily N-acetyltransferase